MQNPAPYQPKYHIRIVTAAALFDGHDAAINIMRRIMQSSGAEVIHLGHNRSAQEIVNCAIQEDVQAIAITSYQGGHNEFFKYIYDLLQAQGAGHIKIFGGGGGTILPTEIMDLQNYGITRIYAPDDGRAMGLQGMINDLLEKSDFELDYSLKNTMPRQISCAENQPTLFLNNKNDLKLSKKNTPVLGITGTGGAGKSSLVDELIRRFLMDFSDKNLAIISVDPSKRKTGGALLGDRIRMNAISPEIAKGRVYMRSLATRQSNLALSKYVQDAVDIAKTENFDLIILETSGIGQSDTEIIEHSDLSLYVMTPEYGAGTQLEKIDMLDFADVIALNKFDKRGGLDALNAVKKQYQRNHNLWDIATELMPVFGTIASQFNDPGVNNLYRFIIQKLNEKTGANLPTQMQASVEQSEKIYIIPPHRTRYLSEITERIRTYNQDATQQSEIATQLFALHTTMELLEAQEDKEVNMNITGRHSNTFTHHPDLKVFRKSLRTNATPAENQLWNMLRGRNLEGRKFRRQHQIGNFIVDFYCPEEALAIELDGQPHFNATAAEYDADRTAFLNSYGVLVIRFENKWVLETPDAVLDKIKSSFGWYASNTPAEGVYASNTPPQPPAERGEQDNLLNNNLYTPPFIRGVGGDTKPFTNGVGADKTTQIQGGIKNPMHVNHWRSKVQINAALHVVQATFADTLKKLSPYHWDTLQNWQKIIENYKNPEYIYQVRGKDIRVRTHTTSLSGLEIARVATPRYTNWGDRLQWTLQENFAGSFPFTSGVFPFKREGEDPARMFAGEGCPERTNKRFHYVSQGMPAKRLSTAFDSVTLYGEDPALRPDIYGKIGNAGVSICCLDDAKKLYSGFDLCDPKTSVSMTINGPAPMLLAFFMNAAIDQQCEKYIVENNLQHLVENKLKEKYDDNSLPRPKYNTDQLPEGNKGLGLLLLGITGDEVLEPKIYNALKAHALSQARGTVQADILKEDQAQNTCIFSTEFALRLMGDVQQYFIDNKIRNFYSVSISGYHIAEAGANPISQLAFTLSNGFTYIEYYISRGMNINDFAPNLSFFFSNGTDPEYSVIGRVARRIWAKAMKLKYNADERSQMLKYHIQTSGRSLHAQEIDFNDIRTTLQALYAIYDNCNSLHTNAYDEAITTPTEESVRRAMAIQLIINKELGLAKNENPMQGSFITEELTDLVEEAVMIEFDRITERGGVLGAMENMYQRNKIQEESMHYEMKKHTGELPIIGVNTFLNSKGSPTILPQEVIRATEEEKQWQLDTITNLHEAHAHQTTHALKQLQKTAINNQNIFEKLMEISKICTLGQCTNALYEVGGQYRRNM